MPRTAEYLKIEDEGVNPGRKTKTFIVRSQRTDKPLGIIKWYSPWRQYVFAPTVNTLFNPDCLRVIVKRCQAETDIQRAKARDNRLTAQGELRDSFGPVLEHGGV